MDAKTKEPKFIHGFLNVSSLSTAPIRKAGTTATTYAKIKKKGNTISDSSGSRCPSSEKI
jgi:hypothetical protein